MSSPSPPFPFPIVVLGDSIQWGQGLRTGRGGIAPDKMAELVGIAFAKNPTVVGAWTAGAGLSVSVHRFTHSGAAINAKLSSGPGTRTTTVSATTAFPAGEVLARTPTILDQAAGAAATLQAASPSVAANSVFLVILDGGINDVGLFSVILNPLVSTAALSAATRYHPCQSRFPGPAQTPKGQVTWPTFRFSDDERRFDCVSTKTGGEGT